MSATPHYPIAFFSKTATARRFAESLKQSPAPFNQVLEFSTTAGPQRRKWKNRVAPQSSAGPVSCEEIERQPTWTAFWRPNTRDARSACGKRREKCGSSKDHGERGPHQGRKTEEKGDRRFGRTKRELGTGRGSTQTGGLAWLLRAELFRGMNVGRHASSPVRGGEAPSTK